TIAVTAAISALNALTLKPAQCATWLRHSRDPAERNAFFRGFNAIYARLESFYIGVIRRLVHAPKTAMITFGALLLVTLWSYRSLPTGFLPTEDQGYVISGILLPDAASAARTAQAIEKMNRVVAETPGVADWNSWGGRSILDGTTASNAGTVFIVFKP